MKRSLYSRLLSRSVLLQKEFGGLDGNDVAALDRLLLRVALRPSAHSSGSVKPATTSAATLEALNEGLQSSAGLTSYVSERFRAGNEADLTQAFESLRFANELLEIFSRCSTVHQNSHAGYELGSILYHTELNTTCVVYSHDCIPDATLISSRDTTQPYCHVVSESGEFLYVPLGALETQSVQTPLQFVETLRQVGSGSGVAFVDGLLFVAATAGRLIPNQDLWLRFPDADGRATASGLSTIPLAEAVYEGMRSPFEKQDTEERPSLLSYITSLFAKRKHSARRRL